VNTDRIHLEGIQADKKLLIGQSVTRGMGAGGRPEVAERCAELERLARAGSVPDLVTQAAAIEACYVAVDRALRTEVGDAGA